MWIERSDTLIHVLGYNTTLFAGQSEGSYVLILVPKKLEDFETFNAVLQRGAGRPTATSIAVVVNWTANFLVGLGFQPMQLLMGPWVFMVFIVIQLFFIVYVAFVVPETKNRTTEEITAQFRK